MDPGFYFGFFEATRFCPFCHTQRVFPGPTDTLVQQKIFFEK